MITVNGYLNSVFDKWTPNLATRDLARNRREVMHNRLRRDHTIGKMFETGSLTHGTGVSRLSDVDYFVEFLNLSNYYGLASLPNPDVAFNRIASSMRSLYPSTYIRVSRPAIKLDFKDNVKVELVPAYATGKRDDEYWIPDPTNFSKWILSSPRRHLDYVNSVQYKCADTKKAIRLLKTWKAVKNVPMSSFYLEMNMAKYMENCSPVTSLDEALRDIFLDLYAGKLSPITDPTNSTAKFEACSSKSSKEEADSKTLNAMAHAAEAVNLRKKGDIDLAVNKWKRIFE